MNLALYDNSGYGAITAATRDAESALARKDVKGAQDALIRGRQLSNAYVLQKKQEVAAAKARGDFAAAEAANAAGLQVVTLRESKIKTALDAVNMMLSQRVHAVRNDVQAPPGAGAFVRIPLTSTVGSTTLPWAYLAAAGSTAVTMSAPDLPYLVYRVHGLLIGTQQVAAALSDSVQVYDLKAKGSNTLLLDEGTYAADSFNFENISIAGLRNFVDIQSPNKPQITVQALSSAGAARSGATIVFATIIAEILEDDDARFGSMNSHAVRFGVDSKAAFGNYGYIGFKGTPMPGNLQRVPMRPAATDVPNTTTNPMVYLSSTYPSIAVQTNSLPYVSCKVVGFEIGKPSQSVETDVVTVEDLKVKGGFTLFPQEDEVPAINYFRREGGVHSMAGLRCYPKLSETNQATLTIEGWSGTLGTSSMAGVARIPGVNVILDVTQDDNFGPGIVSPYSVDQAIALLRG